MIGTEQILRSPSYYLHSREIILYGAGYDGRLYLKNLEYMGAKVIAFCDTFKSGSYCDLPILDTLQLEKILCKNKQTYKHIVISSDNNRNEILLAIKAQGFDEYLLNIDRECLAQLMINCQKTKDANSYKDEIIDFDGHELGKYIGRKRRRSVYESIILDNPLLIYQPGKVGSTTLYNSFSKSIPIVHIHWIYRDYRLYFSEEGFGRFKALLRNRRVKIITMVREPLSQIVSSFFQTLNRYHTNLLDVSQLSFDDVKEDLEHHLELSKSENLFDWFERELERTFEVDIYEFPFDRKKGYTLIKKGNLEILLLKMEKMNSLVDVIGSFGGVENFVLEKHNLSKDKPYAECYKEVKKKFVFKREYVDLFYRNNDKFDHFYSKEEKTEFLNKWKHNLPKGYNI